MHEEQFKMLQNITQLIFCKTALSVLGERYLRQRGELILGLPKITLEIFLMSFRRELYCILYCKDIQADCVL